MENKIYAREEERYIKSQVLYVKSNKLYIDEACTEGANMDVVFNLFTKGMLKVFVTDTYHVPTACKPGNASTKTSASLTVGTNTYTSVDVFA